MVMHGNFDHLMSFSGSTLTVCGPIFWAGTPLGGLPATEITVRHVTVAQLGTHPFSMTPPPVTVTQASGETEWMADIDGDWTAGPASASAFVQLKIAGRKRQWIFETWSETISIVEA
jgi:hypothetical protein